MEMQVFKIEHNQESLHIFKVYILSQAGLNENNALYQLKSIYRIRFSNATLLLEDLNAHHPLWLKNKNTDSKDKLMKQISNMVILNEDLL